MNATLLAWTLMMGGILIPGVDSPDTVPGASENRAPLVDPDLLTTEPSGLGGSFSMPATPPGGPGTGQSFSAFPQPEVPQVNSPTSFGNEPVPFAPTDPGAASGAYPWGPPTAGERADGSSQGASGRGLPSSALAPRLSGSGGYLAPRAARPTYQPKQDPYNSFSTQQARMAPSSNSASPAVKPYQDYRRPSAVSPYMALGQVTSEYNDIDAYNQFVRPRLEQMQTNRSMGSQIKGIRSSVNSLQRETTSLRGMVIPQYYMNYGGYYPALQR